MFGPPPSFYIEMTCFKNHTLPIIHKKYYSIISVFKNTLESIFQNSFLPNPMLFMQLKHSWEVHRTDQATEEIHDTRGWESLQHLTNVSTEFLWTRHRHIKLGTGKTNSQLSLGEESSINRKDREASEVPVITHFLIQGRVTKVCLFCENLMNCTLVILCIFLYVSCDLSWENCSNDS